MGTILARYITGFVCLYLILVLTSLWNYCKYNQCIHSCFFSVLCLVSQLCLTLCDPIDCSPPGSSVHRDSPGKNTGVGSRSLLQGIFPTQG